MESQISLEIWELSLIVLFVFLWAYRMGRHKATLKAQRHISHLYGRLEELE